MKYPVSFRLSAEAIRLLKALAEMHGISQTSVVEMILRETAKREKVETK